MLKSIMLFPVIGLVLISGLVSAAEYKGAEYKDIGTIVVTKAEYFKIIENHAVQQCELNAEDYNFELSACRDYVADKSEGCRAITKIEVPDMIYSKDEVSEYTKLYWLCTTPAPGYKSGTSLLDLFQGLFPLDGILRAN
ncbi:hypothetical protein [Amphritea sp. HPY]|uniref:hypothetical protein n=1 Tax=Amphritea sp. HPY TaxID=3421652 RepID=UPI003D7ECC40